MNIYDIAKQAGVSIATVSRVVNNKGTVSPATRAKVEAVLEQHRYAPSAIARGMVGMPMKKVAVLTVDIREPHYACTAYTIEQAFSSKGYEVILCNTGNSIDRAVQYLESVRSKQADGIILVGSVFNAIDEMPDAKTLLSDIPVVLANGHLSLPNCYSVEVDDELGVSMTVEHLVKMGRSKIVYAKDLDTASANAKCKGYQTAMQKYGLSEQILSAEYGMEGGRKFVDILLQSEMAVDAIVCGEDLTAVGVIKGLQDNGIRVPQEIAVTGYNSSVYASVCSPKLTTIDNKPADVAMQCVTMLEKLMNKEETESVCIVPELILGQST